MDQLTWEKIAEVQGRLEGELMKSYLEAHGIEVELIQEALGHSVIPVAIDGLGRVQVFVAKTSSAEARNLLRNFSGSAIVEGS